MQRFSAILRAFHFHSRNRKSKKRRESGKVFSSFSFWNSIRKSLQWIASERTKKSTEKYFLFIKTIIWYEWISALRDVLRFTVVLNRNKNLK